MHALTTRLTNSSNGLWSLGDLSVGVCPCDCLSRGGVIAFGVDFCDVNPPDNRCCNYTDFGFDVARVRGDFCDVEPPDNRCCDCIDFGFDGVRVRVDFCDVDLPNGRCLNYTV